MNIILENIGRRFNREWIFRGLDYRFESGQSYAILGANGSGKSTLLQVMCGSLSPSEGTIQYLQNDKKLAQEDLFKDLSLAAPYLELIEEFTLREQVDFHFKFKRYRSGLNRDLVIKLSGLEQASDKPIKYFSSGMKQRTRLVLAFCSDTPLLFLDEPASNLDSGGTAWYLELIKNFTSGRLLVICSNQEHEYTFCNHQLRVTDYKKPADR